MRLGRGGPEPKPRNRVLTPNCVAAVSAHTGCTRGLGAGLPGQLPQHPPKCSEVHAHRAHLVYLWGLCETGIFLSSFENTPLSHNPPMSLLPLTLGSSDQTVPSWKRWRLSFLRNELSTILTQLNVPPLGSMKTLSLRLAVLSGFLFEIR